MQTSLKPQYTVKDFLPLILIFLTIIALTTISQIFFPPSLESAMRIFMASFFAIFGLFKIINLKNFASAYQTYDLIAKRFPIYAYLYPFIELTIAILYLTNTGGLNRDIFTITLMLISALGVFLKLRKKEKIPCACLGMVFVLPMTWVTLIEDLLMAIEAGIMIFLATATTIATLPLATQSQIITLRDGDTFELTADEVQKEINGHTFSMLAYNGQIPGPLLKVPQNAEITVNFTNKLNQDTTLHSHGLRLDNAFDGVPDSTQKPIKPNETFQYQLKFPDAGIFWYHPHIREAETQELGLYGNFLVIAADNKYFAPVNREIPLFLDDILIKNGKIPPFPAQANHALMGRFGNTYLTNGQTDYVLDLQKNETIRFYLTNSANTRTFNLQIPNAKIKLVGGDNGRYEKETWQNEVILAPSERAIIEVLFSEVGDYQLQNKTPKNTTTLATFQVSNQEIATNYTTQFQTLRENLTTIAEMTKMRQYLDKTPDKNLRMTIDTAMGHSMMMHGGNQEPIEWEDSMPQMNASMTTKNTKWILEDTATGKQNMDINWQFKKDDLIKIQVTNDKNSMHPMQHPLHFHGQRFLILAIDGQPNNNLVWKDTALIPSGATIDLLLETSNPGTWMAHCHISEHLESGMMFNFTVK